MLNDAEHVDLVETLNRLSHIAERAEDQGVVPVSDAAANASEEIQVLLDSVE